MNRNAAFTCLLAGALLATSFSVDAQPAPAMRRIGFLGVDSTIQARTLEALLDGLRALGHVDGKTILIEYRWAQGELDRLPELAAQLVRLDVEVIVTASPPAIRAAQQATSTIPIVVPNMNDPERFGFVTSLARPGGNITGLAFQERELSSKLLEYFREVVPRLTRLAIIWNRGGDSDVVTLQALEDAARRMGLQVRSLEVTKPEDFPTAVAEAKAWSAQGVFQAPNIFITKHRRVFLDLLAAARLPAACEAKHYVIDGCLMSYGASYPALFRSSAHYVDRILKGAKPAELPVDRAREFELVINRKTLEALGLSVPEPLRIQAEIIP